ncbi:MAG: PrsW family intramembrane metalloprotease [Planctomycetota bacterium]|nr:MAG: PrsW family intramembrane metalloprotease [Planctomycetota bacterium]
MARAKGWKGRDHSLAGEPHLQAPPQGGQAPGAAPSPRLSDEPTHATQAKQGLQDQDISVFAEPSMGGDGQGDWALAYASGPGHGLRLLAMLPLALIAGPMAILAALLALGSHSLSGLLNIVVIGPLIEEVAKVFPFLLLAERKPWWLPIWPLLLLAVGISALGFASIENLIYLHIYIPDPSPAIIAWRWWVCTALHITCSLIAGIGLVVMRHRAWQRHSRGRMEDALPWLIAATVLHGAYNALAVAWETLEPF